jgi:site-specific recombinase XerC
MPICASCASSRHGWRSFQDRVSNLFLPHSRRPPWNGICLSGREQGYSVSHRTRVKTVINGICQWLIEDKHALTRNPTRGVEIKAQQVLAPACSPRNSGSSRASSWRKRARLCGKAIFALGYLAGCRVSDVAHLLMEHTHVGPKIGWLHVGHKGEKFRDIDVLNEARRPLYDYL